jgi:hypothetical protein
MALSHAPLLWRLPLAAAFLAPSVATAGPASTDSAAVVQAIEEYHAGLRANAPARVLAVLGPSFTMFNGNHSGDPHAWQAHLYLAGQDLAGWPAAFLREAGPYENRVEVVRVHLRGAAALVVTRETGRNRFRQWRGELVTYLLGRESGGWRLVGYFIRDIANPS